MPDAIQGLMPFVVEGRALSRAQASQLVPLLPERLTGILAAAGASASAARFCKPFTCGIINAKSGRCPEDCAFCAQARCHNTDAPVHALLGREKLYEHACRLAERGVARMGIVSSGAGPSQRDFENICKAAGHISAQVDIRLCASLGVLRDGQAEQLRQAGFSSYHHNLETSRSFYPAVCSTHAYDLRVETVRRARDAGLRVCSGGLFGLGETWEQRLELAETLQELAVDSIPVNFLIPIKGTALENAGTLPAPEALAVIALFRLMHPGRDIVICGGRGKVLGEWDRLVFSAGANGLMVGDYLTAKGSPFARDRELLLALGLGVPRRQ